MNQQLSTMLSATIRRLTLSLSFRYTGRFQPRQDSLHSKLYPLRTLKELESFHKEIGPGQSVGQIARKAGMLMRNENQSQVVGNKEFIMKLLPPVLAMEGEEMVQVIGFIRLINRMRNFKQEFKQHQAAVNAFFSRLNQHLLKNKLGLQKLTFALIELNLLERDTRTCVSAIAKQIKENPGCLKEHLAINLCKAIAMGEYDTIRGDQFFVFSHLLKYLEEASTKNFTLKQQCELLRALTICLSKTSLGPRRQFLNEICKNIAKNIQYLSDDDILNVIEGHQHFGGPDSAELLESLRKTFLNLIAAKEKTPEQAKLLLRYLDSFSHGNHRRFNDAEQEPIVTFLQQTIKNFPFLLTNDSNRSIIEHQLIGRRLNSTNRQTLKNAVCENPKYIWQLELTAFTDAEKTSQSLEKLLQSTPDFRYSKVFYLLANNEEKLGPKTSQYLQTHRAEFNKELAVGLGLLKYSNNRYLYRAFRKVSAEVYKSVEKAQLPLARKVRYLVLSALSQQARKGLVQFLKASGVDKLGEEGKSQMRREVLSQGYTSAQHYYNLEEVFKLVQPLGQTELSVKFLRLFAHSEEVQRIIFDRLYQSLRASTGEPNLASLLGVLQYMERNDFDQEHVVQLTNFISRQVVQVSKNKTLPVRDYEFLARVLIRYGQLTLEQARFLLPLVQSPRSKPILQARVNPSRPPSFEPNKSNLHVLFAYPARTISGQLQQGLKLLDDNTWKKQFVSVVRNMHYSNLQNEQVQKRLKQLFETKALDLDESIEIISRLHQTGSASLYRQTIELVADRVKNRFMALDQYDRVKALKLFSQFKIENKAFLQTIEKLNLRDASNLRAFIKLMNQLVLPLDAQRLGLLDRLDGKFDTECAVAYFLAGQEEKAKNIVSKTSSPSIKIRLLSELLGVVSPTIPQREDREKQDGLMVRQLQKLGCPLTRSDKSSPFGYYTCSGSKEALYLTKASYHGQGGRILGSIHYLVSKVAAKRNLQLTFVDLEILQDAKRVHQLLTRLGVNKSEEEVKNLLKG